MKSKNRIGKTLFFIKPDARAKSKQILADIEAAGFTIRQLKIVFLTKAIILQLYRYLLRKPKLRKVTFELLEGKMVLVGTVEKKNAIKDFVELCGEHYDPKFCALSSLRRRYATVEPIPVGNKKYYHNVIHRVRNWGEYFNNYLILYGKDFFSDLYSDTFSEIQKIDVSKFVKILTSFNLMIKNNLVVILFGSYDIISHTNSFFSGNGVII